MRNFFTVRLWENYLLRLYLDDFGTCCTRCRSPFGIIKPMSSMGYRVAVCLKCDWGWELP